MPFELRVLARRETRPRVAPRLYAIGHVLAGMSRPEAARLCGNEWRALRGAVVRFNVEGTARLVDRPRPGRQLLLTEGEQAALSDRHCVAIEPLLPINQPGARRTDG